MCRHLVLMLGSFLLVGAFSGPKLAVAESWTGNVNFTLGAKALEEDDWEPVEDHAEFGIHVDFRQDDWPVNVIIALTASGDDDDGYDAEFDVNYDIETTTSELRFGVKKIWEPTTTMRPYLGIGLALINADVEMAVEGFGSADDDDSALGFWLQGGLYWTIAEHFNVGFNLGWSYAKVELFDDDKNAGGGHAGILLGYHW